MKRYLSWSGGKDSSASIVICYENRIHLDGVVMSEVMFDHSRGISGEDPEHIKWVYEVAIPVIENVFGYKVYIVKDNMDYLQEFNAIVSNSKVEHRNGMKRGFFIAGRCVGNHYLKMRPLNKFFKNIGEHEQIVGIACDEPERLARLHKKYTNRRSVLEEFNITEEMTYDICKKYNLLSPTYQKSSRGGCWFCHNQGIDQLRHLRKNYPEYWQLLLKWDNDSPVTFKPNGITVHHFDKRFEFEELGLVPTDKTFRWDMLERDNLQCRILI